VTAIPRAGFTLLLSAALILAGATARGTATAERPRYASGDFWTYRTNLTEAFGLALTGNTTLEAGAVATVAVQGENRSALQLYTSGGGTFTGRLPTGATVVGNWSVDGTDWWETGEWKPVRSLFRLSAEGEIRSAPTPVRVTIELVNETTQRIASDTWRWPIRTNATGSVAAHWNVTQNLTIHFEGVDPSSNETHVEGDYTTTFAWDRTERVVVPAGTFDAEVVREAGPEGGYRLRWYAARAGNDVREEDYNETGGRVARSELTAYRYAITEPPPPFPWLPAMIAGLAVVVVGLSVALAVRARRRRTPVETWMPPEREAPPKSPPSP